MDFDRAYPDNGKIQWAISQKGGAYRLKVSHDGGSTFANAAVESYLGNVLSQDRIAINIATGDSKDVILSAAGNGTVGGAAINEIWRTTDNGVTITSIFTAAYGNTPGICALGRWPYNTLIAYYLANSIYYTEDMFASSPQN